MEEPVSYDEDVEYEQTSRYLTEKRPVDDYDAGAQANYPAGYAGYGVTAAPQVGYHPAFATASYPQPGYDPGAMVRAPTPTGDVHGAAYVLQDSDSRKKDEGDTFV